MSEDQIHSYSAVGAHPNKYALKTFLENFILCHVRFYQNLDQSTRH